MKGRPRFSGTPWTRLWIVLLWVPAPPVMGFTYFDPGDSAHIPSQLSQMGLYASTVSKILDTAAKTYQVNAPAWSDGAVAQRWILLRPGRHIPYYDTVDFFDYPDSTVFAQTLRLEKTPGDSSTRRYWETRVLIKKQDSTANHRDWYGFSYRWNQAETDAFLVSHTPYLGFDTVFFFTLPNSNRQSYKKWHFPAANECSVCHRLGASVNLQGQPVYARTILGFQPAQLKRASALNPTNNQIADLFSQGVFSGTQPNADQLSARFKGVDESPGVALSPAQRFAFIDTVARSYIASNCSGCHDYRSIATGATQINFDFYNLRPAMELGFYRTDSFRLNDTTTFDTAAEPEGRAYYFNALREGGMKIQAGQIWDMAFPVGDPASLIPALAYPGYPALSTLLFRQWARNPAWTDSAQMRLALKQDLNSSDASIRAAAALRSSWIFSKAWGSQNWLDTLTAHGLNMDSVTNGYAWEDDLGYPMPPSATSFLPDTVALMVLGEWVKTYRSIFDPNHPIAGLHGSAKMHSDWEPQFRNNLWYLPKDWQGKPVLLDIHGHAYPLRRVGLGCYALPVVADGMYFFGVGDRFFKIPLLQKP